MRLSYFIHAERFIFLLRNVVARILHSAKLHITFKWLRLKKDELIIICNIYLTFITTTAEILQVRNFSTKSPCFSMHLIHCLTIFRIKVSGWQTNHVWTVSFSCLSVVNRRPRKASLSRPDRWQSEAQGQDCAADAPEPQSSVCEGFQQCGQQCEEGHCKTEGLWLHSSAFTSSFRL